MTQKNRAILSILDAVSVGSQTLMTLGRFVQRHFIPEHVYRLRASGKAHYTYLLKQILGDPDNPEKFPPGLRDVRLRDLTTDDLQDAAAAAPAVSKPPPVQYRHVNYITKALEAEARFSGDTIGSVCGLGMPPTHVEGESFDFDPLDRQ